ncbi:MarR family winged helix-turn-helix transcriptional regulator [Blastochloris tepida]|uniref:HTH marR-type domain-containing protein n=1 Tax=Blastochloris tepida TaxID=2233851 RepID=A0A348G403_9HYPH|nr:MarR family winged helix-turn-helix transcriptional regulator [Blastochloris tepida]BBF94286.1 hypothetical protein BLTE_29710 [Blastochloris tepida]
MAKPEPQSAETGPETCPGPEAEVLPWRYESCGYMVNLVARLFERALAERIAPLGLTTGQFPVLLALWERDGLAQAELVRIVRVEQPTMAQALSRMERDGLIARAADPEDRRRALVRLTERGRAVQAPAVAAAHEVNRLAARGLGEVQTRAFLAVLMQMAANLSCPPSSGPK